MSPEPANVNVGHAGAEPQYQPAPVAQSFILRDLAFDTARVKVKEWFAALTISPQALVRAELEGANDTVAAAAD